MLCACRVALDMFAQNSAVCTTPQAATPHQSLRENPKQCSALFEAPTGTASPQGEARSIDRNRRVFSAEIILKNIYCYGIIKVKNEKEDAYDVETTEIKTKITERT